MGARLHVPRPENAGLTASVCAVKLWRHPFAAVVVGRFSAAPKCRLPPPAALLARAARSGRDRQTAVAGKGRRAVGRAWAVESLPEAAVQPCGRPLHTKNAALASGRVTGVRVSDHRARQRAAASDGVCVVIGAKAAACYATAKSEKPCRPRSAYRQTYAGLVWRSSIFHLKNLFAKLLIAFDSKNVCYG